MALSTTEIPVGQRVTKYFHITHKEKNVLSANILLAGGWVAEQMGLTTSHGILTFTVSENDVVSGTGTKSITYSKAFNLLNSIAITLSVQDMSSGDKYAITSKSKTGFNIAFTNSGGTGVSRTFDYVAKGV